MAASVRAGSGHGSRVHATIGGSTVGRTIKCPLWVQLADQVPPLPTSVYAEEGTAHHEVGEMCLLESRDAIELVGRKVNGFEIEAEGAEAVQVHLDEVRARLDDDAVLLVEDRVEVGKHLGLEVDSFGMVDATVWRPSIRQLSILDYKHGAGVAVDVKGNAQPRFYGLGTLFDHPEWRPKTIELVIVQPRAFHPAGPVRTETITPADLLDFAGEFEAAVIEAYSANPRGASGDHCRWCPAQGVCPVQEREALAGAQDEFGDLLDIDVLTPGDVAKRLPTLAALENWIKALRTRAYRMAHDGALPDWKLVAGRGRRAWIDEDLARKRLKALGVATVDIAKVTEMVTSPAQAEKLIPKAHHEFFEDLITTKPGAPVLAPVSDKRDALDPGAEWDDLPEFEPDD